MSDSYNATFAAKWPEDVAQRGFVPVPKCLITCMGELGLTPQEVAVLCNIIERCWFVGEKSWQKVDTIATNIGRKNSATRAITKSLDMKHKRFIDKEQRYNTSNLYDPSPTGQRISEHLPSCKYYIAEKLKAGSQESSGQDSQNTSDYLEPELFRTNYIKPNNISRSSKNYDSLNSLKSKKTQGKCLVSDDGNHEWNEYSTDKRISDEEDAIYFYFVCIHCGKQFHKKNEYPWNAEYPVYHIDE